MTKTLKSTVDEWIAREIELIDCNELINYIPTLTEVEYLAKKLMIFPVEQLHLSNLKFTKVTSEYFGDILDKTEVKGLEITIRDDHNWEILKKLSKTKIRHLSLSKSKIGLTGMMKLVKLFEKKNNVDYIRLSECDINDDEAVLLIEKLRKLHIRIDLDENKITDDGAKRIAKLLPDVDIDFIIFYRDYEAEHHLTITNIGNYNPYLNKNKFSLNLDGNKLTTEGRLSIVKSIAHLKLSILISFQVSNDDVRFFLENPDDHFGKKIYEALKLGNKYKDTKKENKENDFFTDVIQLLRTIQFDGVRFDNLSVTHSDLKMIAETVEYIKATNFSLIEGLVTRNVVDKLFASLPKSQVTTLDISGNDIDNDGAIIIAENIKKTKITRLDLGSNLIDNRGLIPFIKIIETSNLIELKLENLHIDDELAILLAKILAISKIIILNLSRNNIESKGANAFAQCIPQSKLVTLNLNKNPINCLDVISLVEAVNNSKICKFNVSIKSFTGFTETTVAKVLNNNYLLVSFFSLTSSEKVNNIDVKRNKDYLNKAYN